jgi:hypothetical protein
MDDVPRWPQGDRMYLSHITLKELGWIPGDPKTKVCISCGALCEWWGTPDRTDWKLFNLRTTQRHSETCGS